MDVHNKRRNGWLCNLWQQQDSVVHHRPEASVSFSFSAGADGGLLPPSAGRPVDSLSAEPDGGPESATSCCFILACAGLPERLRLWLWPGLRRPWRRPLRGLALRDRVFIPTTVLSSSELTSELSEELWSLPDVGSWICWWKIWGG